MELIKNHNNPLNKIPEDSEHNENESTQELLFKSLFRYYESRRDEALAVLSKAFTLEDISVLQDKSILTKLVEYTEQLKNADLSIETLKKYFT